MPSIRRILLILDCRLTRTPAVERAEAMARISRAELWIALFDPGPRLGVLGALNRQEALRIEGLMRDQLSTRLEELRTEIAGRGITVHVIDERERMSAEQIVERVAQHGIELVLKDVGHESMLRRLVFLPLDWELLRTCPVPLWMVGEKAAGLPRRVVAAVDPLNPEHGSGPLNDAIIGMAKTLSQAGSGDLRVYTAFAGLPAALQSLDPVGISISSSYEELYEYLRKEHRRTFDALLRQHGLTETDALTLYGPITSSLLEALEGHGADLLVVGVIRRQGVNRLLMGSTVESLIGEATCDLVAVPANAVHTAVPQPRAVT